MPQRNMRGIGRGRDACTHVGQLGDDLRLWPGKRSSIMAVINEYDTKGINHREDMNLTWKIPLKRRRKNHGRRAATSHYFRVVTDRRRFIIKIIISCGLQRYL
jgi:hypothetical protein